MRWLEGSHAVPEVDARPADHGVTAAFRPNGLEAAGDTVQSFVLQRSAGGPESFSLRSNAGWLLAPNTVDLKESSARLDLRYRPEALKNPGVYTGVVSGWTSDTMAGPAFRLVNTIVVPAVGARIETDPQLIPPGASVASSSAPRRDGPSSSPRRPPLVRSRRKPFSMSLAGSHIGKPTAFRPDRATMPRSTWWTDVMW